MLRSNRIVSSGKLPQSLTASLTSMNNSKVIHPINSPYLAMNMVAYMVFLLVMYSMWFGLIPHTNFILENNPKRLTPDGCQRQGLIIDR